MIEVIYGHTTKRPIVRALVDRLHRSQIEGTLYVGYPVVATADEPLSIDALFISSESGLTIIIIDDSDRPPASAREIQGLQEEQDSVVYSVTSALGRHQSLRKGRSLAFDINIVTLVSHMPNGIRTPDSLVLSTIDDLPHLLESFAELPQDLMRPLNAALQRVSTIKPRKKRAGVTNEQSRGAVLKQIEKEIANLDRWQRQAAIESPEGPQRIRGLAGSGKTVVLALKAAYLHAQHPEWNIIVTFYSRSLKPQLRDLIRRFYFEQTSDEPDWNRLRVLHAWGGRNREGVYTEIANALGATPRDFAFGQSTFGMERAFEGVCRELLATTLSQPATPIFDAVLIDEAQDLPAEFFKLVYAFTINPKRIVWAYDELQNLSESAMPSVAELFGTDGAGRAVVNLENVDSEPRRDIILEVCYRNTPWALTMGHALGFGIYRETSLVQHFDEPSLWEEIGYELLEGHLELGASVRLRRKTSSYPEYFNALVQPDDAVQIVELDDENSQAHWVAAAIQKNLAEDELEPDDILVILPNALTAKRRAVLIMSALRGLGIESHLAGVNTSADELFSSESVAISNIYRAKGNEAPMVYLVNTQYCSEGHELIKLRNILFTAITRSRAWIRLCGWGPRMSLFRDEIRQVTDNNYELVFKIPTSSELKQLRMIHRDRTPAEKARLKKAQKAAVEVAKAILEGDLSVEHLPPELKKAFQSIKPKSDKK